MKTALLAIPTLSALLLLGACEQESRPPLPPAPAPAPTGDIPIPTPTPEVSPSPTPVVEPTPPVSSPTPAPSTTGSIPYGVPVPNKPGFVVSPYSQSSGYVDVRGFPPNSEVKDPYSGRTFLVP